MCLYVFVCICSMCDLTVYQFMCSNVSVCDLMCVYRCSYVYLYMFMCVCMPYCVILCVSVCVHVCLHVILCVSVCVMCIFMWSYVFLYMILCVSVCVLMCICMCSYVCMYVILCISVYVVCVSNVSDWDYHAPRAIAAIPDEMAHFHIKTLCHTHTFVFWWSQTNIQPNRFIKTAWT